MVTTTVENINEMKLQYEVDCSQIFLNAANVDVKRYLARVTYFATPYRVLKIRFCALGIDLQLLYVRLMQYRYSIHGGPLNVGTSSLSQ